MLRNGALYFIEALSEEVTFEQRSLSKGVSNAEIWGNNKNNGKLTFDL